jgi:peptidoglycan/LPS O-acetylase OafA/YrhL
MKRSIVIDYIRVVAIALVLIFHSFTLNKYTSLYDIGFIIGLIGVGLFFFVSGYMSSKGRKITSVISYIKNKFIKIYPLYIIIAIISIFTMPSIIYPYCEIVYILMLQAFSPFSSSHLWFISALFFAYILFAFYNTNKNMFIILCTIFISVLLYFEIYRVIAMFIIFFIGVSLGTKYEIRDIKLPFGKIITVIGSSTLSIYLLHVAILTGLMDIYNSPLVFMLVYIPIMIILSVIIQKYYDKIVKVINDKLYI